MVARAAPAGRVRALLLCAVLAALILQTPKLPGEVRSTVRIDAVNTLVFGASEPLSAGLGSAELDLEAVGNSDVRSRLQLRATLLEKESGEPTTGAQTVIDVPRAEVRWRMSANDYTMRFTVGRTRLTWGEGQLYNAGDVINGVRPSGTDLTATTLRDETQWLTVAYFPLGRFSFFEAVALLPMSQLSETTPTGATLSAGSDNVGDVAPVPAARSGGGGRIQGQVAGIKSEAGYLYRGTSQTHQPYLSLQGSIIVDWYASVSWTEGPEGITGSDQDARGIAAGGGLFHTGSGDRLGAVSARVETLWTESDETLRLFPELSWAPSQLLTVYLRGESTPYAAGRWADAAAPDGVAAVGVRWTPSTGLTLSLSGLGDSARSVSAVVATVSYVF